MFKFFLSLSLAFLVLGCAYRSFDVKLFFKNSNIDYDYSRIKGKNIFFIFPYLKKSPFSHFKTNLPIPRTDYPAMAYKQLKNNIHFFNLGWKELLGIKKLIRNNLEKRPEAELLKDTTLITALKKTHTEVVVVMHPVTTTLNTKNHDMVESQASGFKAVDLKRNPNKGLFSIRCSLYDVNQQKLLMSFSNHGKEIQPMVNELVSAITYERQGITPKSSPRVAVSN